MTHPGRFVLALAALAAFAVPASAETIYDVESARANARAGGPVSEHDAWLLERWGATSGTPEWRHRGNPNYVTGPVAKRKLEHRARRSHHTN